MSWLLGIRIHVGFWGQPGLGGQKRGWELMILSCRGQFQAQQPLRVPKYNLSVQPERDKRASAVTLP